MNTMPKDFQKQVSEGLKIYWKNRKKAKQSNLITKELIAPKHTTKKNRKGGYMTTRKNKMILLTADCFNHVSEKTFNKIKDPIDRMQVIHDIAMMLEGYVLMDAEPAFIPKAMKDIERDIKKFIEFHKNHPECEES